MGESETVSGSQEDAVLMRRLDSLVLRLLAHRFKTAEGFWRIELDLLKLQRDTQAAITRAKGDHSTEGRHELLQFQGTLWHAKRFGDALAWLLFKQERRRLYPLSENSRVPVLQEGHGARGLIAAASALSERLGFPLLHDITDLLRVGDITFFRKDEPPSTVEVKTTIVDSKTKGRLTTINYSVTAVWPADDQPPKVVQRPPGRPKQAAMTTKRFQRQLERMTRARAMGVAQVGKTTVIGGQPTLILEARSTDSSEHWPLLRRLVRRARQTGYACGVADGATLYAVLYSATGPTTELEGMKQLPSDLLASGFLFSEPDRNSILVSTLPDPRGDGPHRYLPYYLYPLPRTAIVEMLHGRLVIISILNEGKVAAALQEAGFHVGELTGGPNLKVSCELQTKRGRYRAELPGINDSIREMIMEARPLAYVVSIATSLAEGIARELPVIIEGLEDERRRGSRGVGR